MRSAPRTASPITAGSHPSLAGRWLWTQIAVCGLLGWGSFAVAVDYLLPRAARIDRSALLTQPGLPRVEPMMAETTSESRVDDASDGRTVRERSGLPSRLAGFPQRHSRVGQW
jgi:hypothetical protein